MRNLALSLLSIVLIATIGLGWMFDNIYSQYQNQSAINKPETDAITVLEQVGTQLAKTLDNIENRQQFILNWPRNDNVTLNLVRFIDFPLPKKLSDDVRNGQALLLETDDSIAMHFYLPQAKELLILTTPQLSLSQQNSLISLVLTSLFYLAVLLLMFLWLYPLAKRLLALRQAAKLFGEGDLSARIEVGSISYIRDIELEFNRMAQRIGDLVSDIKLLSSAVSHDLRTPLARIRFGIDTISEEDDPILRKRFEQRISDNVDEMVDLVETLLSYARLDQTLITLNKAPVDIIALVATCIKNKSEDTIELTFNVPEQTVFVYGDLSYLMILVANLLQNAYQYCHTKIQVDVLDNDDFITLVIADDGEGIAVDQQDQIMKPFIRGKDSKQKVKGYGMGLAIVKRIVQWHQGSIDINHCEHLSGAKFTIELPKETKHN